MRFGQQETGISAIHIAIKNWPPELAGKSPVLTNLAFDEAHQIRISSFRQVEALSSSSNVVVCCVQVHVFGSPSRGKCSLGQWAGWKVTVAIGNSR